MAAYHLSTWPFVSRRMRSSLLVNRLKRLFCKVNPTMTTPVRIPAINMSWMSCVMVALKFTSDPASAVYSSCMTEKRPEPTEQQRAELDHLATLRDEDIDVTEMPVVTDFSKAVRGLPLEDNRIWQKRLAKNNGEAE